jgi:hypothetical protein
LPLSRRRRQHRRLAGSGGDRRFRVREFFSAACWSDIDQLRRCLSVWLVVGRRCRALADNLGHPAHPTEVRTYTASSQRCRARRLPIGRSPTPGNPNVSHTNPGASILQSPHKFRRGRLRLRAGLRPMQRRASRFNARRIAWRTCYLGKSERLIANPFGSIGERAHLASALSV